MGEQKVPVGYSGASIRVTWGAESVFTYNWVGDSWGALDVEGRCPHDLVPGGRWENCYASGEPWLLSVEWLTPEPATAAAEQPDPTPSDGPAVWSLVIRDMADRDAMGAERYGTRLQPHNGRDALRDAYEEALDLCVYMRQALFERDGR